MTALKHLLIQELNQIRVTESRLQDAYPKLDASQPNHVERFVDSLRDLQHRAARMERLLDALGDHEPLAA